VFNPANPVPTVGGNELFGGCGPQDQRPVEQGARSDVLTFTSDVFNVLTPMVGPVKASIYVSSTANDTDVTVKLTDVHSDGSSLLIYDGIRRMRWRDGYGPQDMTPLTPGTVYLAEIDLEYTAYLWAPGHRMRVSVSSSNFPRFSVNPNNFASIVDADTIPPVIATNTILFSQAFPSHITIPVVPISSIPESQVLMQLAYD